VCENKPKKLHKRYKLATYEAKKQIDKARENKPTNRFKPIKRCELKKSQQNVNLKSKASTIKQKNLKNLKIVKTTKFKQRAKARRTLKKTTPSRIKFQNQKNCRRPNMYMKMNVNDPQECSNSENSSLNFSEPVFIPRKPSSTRPLGFKALLCKLFGLNTKRRPKPQPFQF